MTTFLKRINPYNSAVFEFDVQMIIFGVANYPTPMDGMITLNIKNLTAKSISGVGINNEYEEVKQFNSNVVKRYFNLINPTEVTISKICESGSNRDNDIGKFIQFATSTVPYYNTKLDLTIKMSPAFNNENKKSSGLTGFAEFVAKNKLIILKNCSITNFKISDLDAQSSGVILEEFTLQPESIII